MGKTWKIFMNNAQIVQPIAVSNDSFVLAAGMVKGLNASPLPATRKVKNIAFNPPEVQRFKSQVFQPNPQGWLPLWAQ